MMTTHPSNKFVRVTICRARGLLSRDATHAVAPITSEGLDIFVTCHTTYRVTDRDLMQPPQLLEPALGQEQLTQTPAVGSTPANPTWVTDDMLLGRRDPAGLQRCTFECAVAAMPLVFDVWGRTLSKQLFLGRATLRAEQVMTNTNSNKKQQQQQQQQQQDSELRLELLPRPNEADRVVLTAIETFSAGLGLLVVAAKVVDAPPPPPPPVPPPQLISITVPRINVLSPERVKPLHYHSGMSMCLVPDVAQPQRPGLVDVTIEQQNDALALEARNPATPLHAAQMLEISLHSCAPVIHTWVAELRAIAQLFNPGKPPPPPPQRFEVIADVFGATFSSGLLSTDLEDVQQYYRSSNRTEPGDCFGGAGGGSFISTTSTFGAGAGTRRNSSSSSSLSLFSIYGSVCAAAGSAIPIRLRFVDGTANAFSIGGKRNGKGDNDDDNNPLLQMGNSSSVMRSTSSSSNTSGVLSSTTTSGAIPQHLQHLLHDKSGSMQPRHHLPGGGLSNSLYDGREVFAETLMSGCSVPVPHPEQYADTVNPAYRSNNNSSGGALVGNRALLPIAFNSKHGLTTTSGLHSAAANDDHHHYNNNNSNNLHVELSIKSVSCVPAKSVTRSSLFHGRTTLKIEVREVRDLVTPQMLAAAAAAAKQPTVGSLRATQIGLHHSPSNRRSSSSWLGRKGSAVGLSSHHSEDGTVGGGGRGKTRSPSAADSATEEKESDRPSLKKSQSQQSLSQQQEVETNADTQTLLGAEDDKASEKSAATTTKSRQSNKYQYSAAAASTTATTKGGARRKHGQQHQQQQSSYQPQDPIYCEVAIKDRVDDKEFKLLGKSPYVIADNDSFFGFTTTVELPHIHPHQSSGGGGRSHYHHQQQQQQQVKSEQLPEVIIVGIFQGSECIARSIVHVLERKSIDGTWVTLKPPVKRGQAAGEGLRGMVWVRWVASTALPPSTTSITANNNGHNNNGDADFYSSSSSHAFNRHQQQQQLLLAEREREQALSVGNSGVPPVTWIQHEALVPDLVRSPAAPNGVCEMVLPTQNTTGCAAPTNAREAIMLMQQQQDQERQLGFNHSSTAAAAAAAGLSSFVFGSAAAAAPGGRGGGGGLTMFLPHEVGYREAGALCIDWNSMPVGYCLRVKQGDRTLFGPALRVRGHTGALKAPPVIVYLEATVNGAPPLLFQTFRCPEEGAALVVRESDKVYERKCWLPVDVNLLSQHPPAAHLLPMSNNNNNSNHNYHSHFDHHASSSTRPLFQQQQGEPSSWLQSQAAASAAGISLCHHLSGSASSHPHYPGSGGTHQHQHQQRQQHPPCFTIALDEIAAIKIPCRWVPLVKSIPPPAPNSRSSSMAPLSPEELELRQAKERAAAAAARRLKKVPPMYLRIVGPAFCSMQAALEEENTLEKIMPAVERHFGIAIKDQLFHQGKLKLLPNGRPQAAGTASREQAHLFAQPAVVARLAGEAVEDSINNNKIKVMDIILSSKDPRALYLSVKVPTTTTTAGSSDGGMHDRGGSGIVVPMSVPYQTNIASLKELLKIAIVERKLGGSDPSFSRNSNSMSNSTSSNFNYAQAVAAAEKLARGIKRLCHLNRILPDETPVRKLGLRSDVPLIAMMEPDTDGDDDHNELNNNNNRDPLGATVAGLSDDEGEGEGRTEELRSLSSSVLTSHLDVHPPFATAIGPSGTRSPPAVPPLQLNAAADRKGDAKRRNNVATQQSKQPLLKAVMRTTTAAATAAATAAHGHAVPNINNNKGRSHTIASGGGGGTARPASAQPAPAAGNKQRQQQLSPARIQNRNSNNSHEHHVAAYKAGTAVVEAATNHEYGATSARAMMEVKELNEKLEKAYARISQLEQTVETQRVLLKRCADAMG